MTLLDNGWTDEQAQGLLQSLNLDGGTQVETGTPPEATILVPRSRKGFDHPRWAT